MQHVRGSAVCICFKGKEGSLINPLLKNTLKCESPFLNTIPIIYLEQECG